MQNNTPQGQRTQPGFNKGTMPDFPAWMTNQITQEQHHLQSPYLSNESKSSNTHMKVNNAGIGGLVNGDICDSNTFLNYVLSQQRSSGIFVFDNRANSDPNQTYTTNCQNCEHKASNSKTPYPTNAKVRNIPDSDLPTFRDASTNTTLRLPPDFDTSSFKDHCNTSEHDVARNFCNQLGLQQRTSTKYEQCKSCGTAIEDATCRNCSPVANAKACKWIQDCDAECIKNNRRIHFLDVDRPFTCSICLKNYPSESSLVNHIRYHKGNKPYQCETCNKAFATNSHLTTHKRTHSGEKPFECLQCFKTFSDRSSFVKHSRTHGPDGTTVKKYKCPVCGNFFVDSCGLKKHIRIHTGERPYQCATCDKTFATSSTFVAHKRIHSGERPYSCPHCPKRFITKSHLLTHGRVHSGEKPFTCRVCSRAFADGSSYRRHERLHTGENRYTCDVCDKGFPLEASLAKHKQSHVPGTASYVYARDDVGSENPEAVNGLLEPVRNIPDARHVPGIFVR